jgi:outer membrane protein OmpA-like peptidoglycan-associated protein
MKLSYVSYKNVVNWLTIIVLTGTLAGCSVATPPALTEARNAYQRAEKNPDIAGNAAVALHDAQQTLNRAEREWEQNRDQAEAEHLAYLTKQRVEIAQRLAERNMAEKEIQGLSEERQKVIMEARERELLQTRKEAEERAREAERAQQQTLAAQDQAAARAQEAEQARKTVAQARAETEAARQQEQEAAAKSKALEKQLSALRAKMKQTDRGLVLTLGDVLFDFDRAELKAGTLRNLYPLVSFLKDNSSRSVAIEGHTDNVGSASYNRELSQRRAEAVRNFLTDNGIAQDRVSARGLGEDYPVASNNSESGRQMNRRVEIVISNETQTKTLGN